MGRAYKGAEVRYLGLEKLVLSLISEVRRLQHYFQSHNIVVVTDQPLRRVLGKPELSGRLLKWAVELDEFDIQYQPRAAIKAQALADFIVELTPTEEENNEFFTSPDEDTQLPEEVGVHTPYGAQVGVQTPSRDKVCVQTPSGDKVGVQTPSGDKVGVQTPSGDKVGVQTPSRAQVGA